MSEMILRLPLELANRINLCAASLMIPPASLVRIIVDEHLRIYEEAALKMESKPNIS